MEKRRKSPRLKNHDYGIGAYFVTICTHGRICLLSEIDENNNVILSEYGKIADKQIKVLNDKFPDINVDSYVIMPNHIHLIIRINPPNEKSITLPQVIRVFKSQTSRLCDYESPIFQRSYHDHIIRDHEDYVFVSQYIKNNPKKWGEDCFHNP